MRIRLEDGATCWAAGCCIHCIHCIHGIHGIHADAPVPIHTKPTGSQRSTAAIWSPNLLCLVAYTGRAMGACRSSSDVVRHDRGWCALLLLLSWVRRAMPTLLWGPVILPWLWEMLFPETVLRIQVLVACMIILFWLLTPRLCITSLRPALIQR